MVGLKAATYLTKAYEPIRQFDFEVVLTLPGGGSGENLTLSVESGFLPNVTNEEIEVPFWNSRIWVAGKASYETGTLTVRDFLEAKTCQLIWDWYQRVYKVNEKLGLDGTIGLQKDYKAAGYIQTYAPGHSANNKYAKWLIDGVWPTAVNFGTVDYTANDIVKIELTLRYEHAYLKAVTGAGH